MFDTVPIPRFDSLQYRQYLKVDLERLTGPLCLHFRPMYSQCLAVCPQSLTVFPQYLTVYPQYLTVYPQYLTVYPLVSDSVSPVSDSVSPNIWQCIPSIWQCIPSIWQCIPQYLTVYPMYRKMLQLLLPLLGIDGPQQRYKVHPEGARGENSRQVLYTHFI